ncbi:hypothetical protein BC828DRAFT_400611 [Blastocladiella britannica]|nr:hypothetical protein BC828DRAFT_400611 [Blastocladiella britannica]
MTGEITASSFTNFKSQIIENLRNRVRRAVLVEGKWALEDEEATTANLGANLNVFLRFGIGKAGHMFDPSPGSWANKTINLTIFKYSMSLKTVADHRAFSADVLHPIATDRAGAPNQDEHNNLIAQLKGTFPDLEAQDFVWGIWATSLLKVDAVDREHRMRAGPPEGILSFFQLPVHSSLERSRRFQHHMSLAHDITVLVTTGTGRLLKQIDEIEAATDFFYAETKKRLHQVRADVQVMAIRMEMSRSNIIGFEDAYSASDIAIRMRQLETDDGDHADDRFPNLLDTEHMEDGDDQYEDIDL